MTPVDLSPPQARAFNPDAPITASERADDVLTPLDRWLDEQRRLTPVERFAREHDQPDARLTGRWRDLLPIAPPGPGQQYAFDVDLDACTGCKSCVAACHSLNGLDEGETWRAVGLLVGSMPDAAPVVQHVTTACHHCLDPACLNGCPVDAYEKDPITGIVRHLDDQCIGCRYCTLMCPYEVPVYNADLGIVRKCDLCADRLADGEAPACAQACPTEAIRIAVVSVEEIRGELGHRPDSMLVPTAPPSGLTGPTTRYRSARGLPPQLRAGDEAHLVASHAHPPLVVMLVLTQLAAGVALGQAVLHLLQPDLVDATRAVATVATASVGVIAMGASTLHLGRPLHAWRAVLGIGHSWLSREIVAFSAFGALAGALAVARVTWGATVLGGAASDVFLAGVGLTAVAVSAMVYAACGKRWWRLSWTLARFFATTITTGAAASAVLLVGLMVADRLEPSTARTPLTVLVLVALVVPALATLGEAMVLTHRRGAPADELAGTTALLLGPVREVAVGRLCAFALQSILGLMALGTLRGTPLDTGGLAGLTVAFAFAVMAGEVLARHLFFVAVASARMPGAPR